MPNLHQNTIGITTWAQQPPLTQKQKTLVEFWKPTPKPEPPKKRVITQQMIDDIFYYRHERGWTLYPICQTFRLDKETVLDILERKIKPLRAGGS